MFGHHKIKVKKHKKKRMSSEKHAQLENQKISDKVAQSKANQTMAREEGRADTESFFNKDVQGLDPKKRQAMQYEANKSIQRNQQSANRKLLGDQATHGILGKGGVAYSQQRDLQKMGDEAKAGVHRDLEKLNSDLATKKQAAIFAGGEGRASQAHLDQQSAANELALSKEKKRQRKFEDAFYKQFSRV